MTFVIAHRGASRARPPGNTIEAFRAALALGADWVELDVRRSADGGLAVHHDAHLADGRAIVDVASNDLPGEVPSLASALHACAGMGVNVEIKNAPGEPDFDEERQLVDAVLSLLDGADHAGHLVTSFDVGALERVGRVDPTVPRGLLSFDLERPEPTIELAAELGCSAINPWDAYVTAAFVERCHGLELDVNVWTVNDPGRMQELLGMGVDGIITDVPDVLCALIDRSG
jgi:glycerophosphoryl diester phosphodiesterase